MVRQAELDRTEIYESKHAIADTVKFNKQIEHRNVHA